MSTFSFFTKISFGLIFTSLFLSTNSTAHAAYPFGDELIRYSFEEGTGAIENTGTGGNTYDSALSGNAAYYATTTSPFGGYGVLFDTADDYVTTGYGSGIDPTASAISVSLWVNNQGTCSTDRHIFGHGVSGQNTRFYIRCRSTTGQWNYRIGGAAEVNAATAGTVQPHRWYHLVLLTEGTNAAMYVNGVHQGTTTISSYTLPGNLYVGTINGATAEGGNAVIDEVAIYNRSLTATEVKQIYTAGAAVTVSPTTADVTEGGATDTYTVVLKTAPTADVTVTVTESAEAGTSPDSLTFTSSNWFTPQTVTITAVDDEDAEGEHETSISHTTSSSDPNYNVITVDDVNVTITDNEADSAPTISSVSSDKTNGFYGAGEIIDIDITFSEAVTATTSITVTLETGTTDRTCSIASISNSSTASCNYTVQAGDVTTDLTVSTISGYIEDQTANPITNFAPSTNLAANKAIGIGTYISFITPSPSANSTTTSSSVTVYASSTIQTTATSTAWNLFVTTPAGAVSSQVSTTTRYGDYNLTHYTNTISNLDLSLTANTSGSIYVPTTGTIFIPHNTSAGNTTSITEIASTTGAVVRTITCTSCGDIEGITLVSSLASSTAPGVFDHTFVLSTEDVQANGRVFKVIIPSTGSVTVTNSDAYSTGIAHGANTGLEGIAYNSSSGVFYLAEESASATLYEYPSLGGTAVQICANLDFTSIATDFSDLYYNNNGILFVLSDNSSRIVPVNITSTSTCAFVDSDGDGNTSGDTGDYLNSVPVGATDQAEGLTFDNTGDYLYIFGEADYFARYRTNAYTVRHTFTGISNGSYLLKASSTDATTGLITHSGNSHAFGVNVDASAPTISTVSSSKTNGSYTVGEVIDIDVTFSEAVTSTGNVTVTLETGATDRTCTFTVSNSTTGTCDYTVQAGDTSADLEATISGTIADQSANAMSNFVPSTNLAASKALVIDTTAPTVSTLSPADNATGVSVTANLVITFDTAVSTSTGNILIKLASNDSTVETIDVAGSQVTDSGSNSFTINPSVTLGSLTGYYVQVASTAFRDVALNSYAGIANTTSWSFTTADVGVPTISSVSSSKTNGTYDVGEVIDIDVTFSEAVTSTGNVTVTLETGATDRTCTFTVSNSTTGTCDYTVQAGDTSADLEATISGTIADQSANAMSDFVPATGLAANKALVIDTDGVDDSDDDDDDSGGGGGGGGNNNNDDEDEEEETDSNTETTTTSENNSGGSNTPTQVSTIIQNTLNAVQVIIESAQTTGEAQEVTTNKVKQVLENTIIKLITELKSQVEILKQSTSQSQGALSDNFAFTVDLKLDMVHPQVKELQKFLNNNGFVIASTGPGSPGNETTIFGDLTEIALKKFQEAHRAEILTPLGLTEATGYFGSATRKIVNRLISNQ